MKSLRIPALASGILLVLLLGCAGTPEPGAKTGVSTEEVQSIASVFLCDCGMPQCVNMRLDQCSCVYAIETRMYIRQLLASGKHTREEILRKVHKKYGGLREGAQ